MLWHWSRNWRSYDCEFVILYLESSSNTGGEAGTEGHMTASSSFRIGPSSSSLEEVRAGSGVDGAEQKDMAHSLGRPSTPTAFVDVRDSN